MEHYFKIRLKISINKFGTKCRYKFSLKCGTVFRAELIKVSPTTMASRTGRLGIVLSIPAVDLDHNIVVRIQM